MRNYQKLSVIGIDLGKNWFHLCGVDKRGNRIFQQKLSRDKFMRFFSDLPKCTICFEACGGAHHLARFLMGQGFEVRIIAPQFVKPYVKSNKNDWKDAEAICEASTRPSMRFVGVKSVEQQEVQMLHRIRARVMKQRTSVVNEMRGFLLEFGIALPQGISHARKGIPCILSNENTELSSNVKRLISELYDELCLLDERIKGYDRSVKQIASSNEVCQRLLTVKGIGPLSATALYSSTTPSLFKNGRQFAASLGLVPRQETTGGKPKLLGISKRGDSYLRQLMVHGARSVVKVCKNDGSRYGHWVQNLKGRKNFKIATVGVANKNARIAWALLMGNEVFNPDYVHMHYRIAA